VTPPIPILRISLSNASLLSTVYLSFSILLELSNRWMPLRWTERLTYTIEWLPARTLNWLRLFEPLRRAVVEDRLSIFGVRMIYGAVNVLLIFAIAIGVGTVMRLGYGLVRRSDS
jgi:hypothetical protein